METAGNTVNEIDPSSLISVMYDGHKLKEVRAAAIEHARIARGLARERRLLIDALLAEGVSQATSPGSWG